jgi:hypothetical protein
MGVVRQALYLAVPVPNSLRRHGLYTTGTGIVTIPRHLHPFRALA